MKTNYNEFKKQLNNWTEKVLEAKKWVSENPFIRSVGTHDMMVDLDRIISVAFDHAFTFEENYNKKA